MKTKVILAILVSILFFNASNASTLGIEVKESSVKWLAKKVSGEHYGQINIKSGEINIVNGILTSGKIVIDMNTITVTDIQNSSLNEKLVGHLKSDDFFGVSQFQTATYEIKTIKPKTNEVFVFEGEITIKGITKPLTTEAKVIQVNNKYVATGEMVIDRSLFNVKYGSGKFFDNLGDKVIYDEFTLTFKVITK